ncbi:MAG: DUF1517 domain-containing protein, partial [Sandaracinaceae bacterium]
RRGGPSGGPGGGGPHVGPDAMHVSQLSLGIDWRARRQLQADLRRLAETGDTSSPEGLARLLQEAVLALRRAELSWLYVGFQGEGPFAPPQAEQRFRQLAMNARAAFRHEVVRAEGGDVQSREAPEMQARAEEGEGVVVVQLLIAAYRSLSGLEGADADGVRAALDRRAGLTTRDLGALEVIWSPAEDNDRMSTAELEQLYPDLELIAPESIAGRIFCSYCSGPFPMELLACPHCGAPAEASRGNRAPPRAR